MFLFKNDVQRYSSSVHEPAFVSPSSCCIQNNMPQSVSRGSCPGFFCKDIKCFGEAVVYIKGRRIVDGRVDKALIDLCGELIRLLVELAQPFADHLPVKVDRRHALDIATVGHLIAVRR